jgi:serine/threonine protein kinase/TolA-binding protein
MVGQSVAHFRIVERLGAGGMGVVYKAEDLRLGRVVALKFLTPELSSSPTAVERFLREARTASALNHPNICTIYSIEESEGQRFLAMELLDGRSLAETIGGQPMPVDTVLDLALQIADALDAAHSHGVLHRDIKPANIFVTRRGLVKVLDFGLAKMSLLARESDAHDSNPTMAEVMLTTEGLALGTAAYMSPEQARGETLDARSDIFSFGLVLYEMVTGHQAFPGRTSAVVFDAILNRDPPPISAYRTDLPPELEQIVVQALDKDPVGRFQNMSELRAELTVLKRARESGQLSAAAASALALDLSHDEMPTVRMPRPSGAVRAAAQASGSSAGAMSPSGAAARDVPPTPGPADVSAGSSSALPPPAASGRQATPTSTEAGAVAAPVAATAPRRAPSRPRGVTRVVVVGGLACMIFAGAAIAWNAWRHPSPGVVGEGPAAGAVAAPATLATNGAAQAAISSAAATAVPVDVAGVGAPGPASRPAPPRPRVPAAAVPPAPTRAPLEGGAIVPVLPRASPQRVDPGRLLLTAARSKYDAKLLDQARADVQVLLRDHPSSTAAPGAWLLSARIDADQGRLDEAIAALSQLRSRFPDDAANAEGSVRLGQLLERTKRADRVPLARQVLGDVPRAFPDSPWAPRALAQRALLETRERVKDTDPALGSVPAALLSHRALVEQYPSAPEAEFSWWQMAAFYEDRKIYDKAAAACSELGTRFPETRYDAWWRAAEIYDKRLKDDAAAKAAYRRVPSSSPRYKDAQKRAQGR